MVRILPLKMNKCGIWSSTFDHNILQCPYQPSYVQPYLKISFTKLLKINKYELVQGCKLILTPTQSIIIFQNNRQVLSGTKIQFKRCSVDHNVYVKDK